jgi:hypothetical protein
LEAVAEHFGVEKIDNMSREHVPMFSCEIYVEEDEQTLFYGEISTKEPRRWKKMELAASEEFDVVESSADEVFQELRYFSLCLYLGQSKERGKLVVLLLEVRI